MNARWFRDNLSVLVFAVVFVGALAGIIYFLREASAAQTVVLQDLESQTGEMNRLQGTQPYPSSENINVVKQDIEQVRRLYGYMQNSAVRPPITGPDPETPIEFSQAMRATTARLNEAAGSAGVKVTDTFAWGFSRYVAKFPCSNPTPKPDECKRILHLLNKQVLTVEKLSQMLIVTKPESIASIRHTEVEPGSGDGINAPITDDAKLLYHTYPFELVFTTDTERLRKFLNSLSQADSLFLIRGVRVDSTSTQIKDPSAPIHRREELDPGARQIGRAHV